MTVSHKYPVGAQLSYRPARIQRRFNVEVVKLLPTGRYRVELGLSKPCTVIVSEHELFEREAQSNPIEDFVQWVKRDRAYYVRKCEQVQRVGAYLYPEQWTRSELASDATHIDAILRFQTLRTQLAVCARRARLRELA